MRNRKVLPLTIALVFVLLTTTVYAAYGSITALSGGSISERQTSETLVRAKYTDDTVSEDVSQKYISIFGGDIARKGLDGFKEFYNEWYDENKYDENLKDVKEYIFNERNELKEKELEILENKNIDISLISLTEKGNGIFHVNAAYINDYPEYRTLYIDYMDEHVGIGDYLPSGIYIDKELNKAYFVSISDNEIYTYDLEKQD